MMAESRTGSPFSSHVLRVMPEARRYSVQLSCVPQYRVTLWAAVVGGSRPLPLLKGLSEIAAFGLLTM
jgi:hypothetical protein